MKKLLFGILFWLIAFSVQAQSPATIMPSFKFYTAAGTGFTKNQIPASKQSLVMFFDGTCGHCQKVMTDLAKREKELSGVNVYLISLDEFRTIDYFMNRYGQPLLGKKNVTLLQDRDHIFIPLFKPVKYPALYLYSADKRLKIYTSDENDLPKLFSMLKS